MKWALRVIFTLQVLVVVAFIAGIIYVAPYAGAALEGAVDRFDHMIDYEETD